MTDHTESDGRDHTRNGVHEGRLLNASPVLPVLPAKTESASEYAELLADIDFYELEGDRSVLDSAIAAIRALEAKVRDENAMLEKVIEDQRDRIVCLTAEVDRQRLQIEHMRAEYNARAGVHLLAEDKAERLTLEVAALREDAARYRWLRQCSPVRSDRTMHVVHNIYESGRYIETAVAAFDKLDAAIDAARRAGEGEA